MIDTVKLHQPIRLGLMPSTWHWKRYQRGVPHDDPDHVLDCVPSRFLGTHPATGLRVIGSDETILWTEFELPKLVFGHNGRLISSNRQIREGFSAMREILREVGREAFGPVVFERIDLVWQFRLPTPDFIDAYRHARHPRIRRAVEFYNNQTIWWRGKTVQIQAHDKTRLLGHRRGGVTRLEVRFQGRRSIEREFGSELNPQADDPEDLCGPPEDVLDVHRLYGHYRHFLLPLEPEHIGQIGSLAELIAIGEVEGWRHGGLGPMDLYRRGHSRSQYQRMRRRVQALRPRFSNVSLAQLLPEHDLPPVVNVEPRDATGRDA